MMRIAKALSLVLAALSVAVATPAGAQTRFDPHGAAGDAGTDLVCPDDMVLTGLEGNVGAWIDMVQIDCGPIRADGYVLHKWISKKVGGTGGGRKKSECETGMMMTNLDVSLTPDKRKVYLLSGQCKDPRDGRTRPLTFGGVGVEEDCPIGICDRPAEVPRSYVCYPDETPVGIAIRHGQHVNAVGLICGKRERQAPSAEASAAPPPAPVPSAPGPPRVIRSTGRHTPRGFTGEWSTTTGQGATFTITLVSMPDGKVTGSFIHTGPGGTNRDYTGTLEGTLENEGRVLNYKYKQNNGGTGSGYFLVSEDGGGIDGAGKTTDGTRFTWKGTRQ